MNNRISKKQYETTGDNFSIVARPEGPPIVSLLVGAARLPFLYCLPVVLQNTLQATVYVEYSIQTSIYVAATGKLSSP
jgi:hypothetical protein